MATVSVAVKSAEGRGSQRAVRWAVENLMQSAADRLVLVHVMAPITSVPTPSGGAIPIKELDASVAEMYIQDLRARCEETFLTFKYLYKTQKIETLLLEGENPASALLRYISDSRTTSLVLGSCSSNYFARKPKDSEVPSVVLKHAPDTCGIYVVSGNKLTSNLLNPMLTTESGRDTHALSKHESSLSSSSSESKYYNCLSDVSHPHSQAQTPRFSSHQVSEDSLPHTVRNKRFPSISSTYSDQSDIQAEIEQLRLEVENTMIMYNRACEDLVHAQSKEIMDNPHIAADGFTYENGENNNITKISNAMAPLHSIDIKRPRTQDAVANSFCQTFRLV
ncbi:U-box domain-containing protein 34 [Sesamum angolense]|uniref:RING-type E3 ubiquitin transferase n=1 Tax=Sesamum angolense TaxID=2727404 RepID=A0AAE1WEB6_9LAMI|nr:U-box domain-containing protein 34 [Sesamum angolense]